MKQIKKIIPGIWLADTALFTAFFVLIQVILHWAGLMFRKWVLIIGVLIIIAGVIAGIYQMLMMIRKTWLKASLITAFTVLIIAGGTVAAPVVLFAVAGEEHVVTRPEGKYVAHVNGWLHTYVYYHEYKNFLVEGEATRIEEYYGKGGFDPLKRDREYDYNVISTTYYDEDGSVTSETEMNGD